MGERRVPPRRRSPKGALRAAVRAGLACAAILAGATAIAADLRVQGDFGAGRDDNNGLSREYLRQVYQLRYAHQVSHPIHYRLGLLYQDDRGRLSGLAQERQQAWELAPSAHVTWRPEGYSLVLSSALSLGEAFDSEQGGMISRNIERYGATSRLRLMENAELVASANRLAFSGGGADTTRDTVGLGFDWKLGPVQIVNVNRADRYEDASNRITRTALGPRIAAQYAQTGPRWALGARYEFDYTRTEQRALASTSGIVPFDFQPLAGLYAQDDLPDDTAMASRPGLIDGNLSDAGGVDVGPTGSSHQNVGLDMGRPVTVDELRVHVRNAAGQPLPFGGPVTWAVWSSQDGTRWTPVPGASQTFSLGTSAYILGFSSTPARFFKVVNFLVNTVDTFVTEIQPLYRGTFVAGETHVAHAVRQGLGLDVTATLAPKAILSYLGQVHASSATGFVGPTRYSGDTTNIGSVKLGPYGDYSFDVAAAQYYTRAPSGQDHSKFAVSGTTRYRPIERFTAGFEARRALERLGAIRSTTTGASISSTATVYDSLLTGTSVGFSRQAFETGDSTDYLTASGNAIAQVRRDIELRLDVAVQRSVAEQGNPQAILGAQPLFQTLVFQRYSTELRYRPSTQLDLLGRIGYAATPSGDGILQKARVNWEPFPGGNVRLAFDYDVEVDALTGRSYRQLSASPQWLINRHATLALQYNDVRGSGGAAIRQQSVNLSLSIML